MTAEVVSIRIRCSCRQRFFPFLHGNCRTRQYPLHLNQNHLSEYTGKYIHLPIFLVYCQSYLSLNDKAVWLSFPLFHDNGVQFEFYSVDFLTLPSPENEHVIIKSGTSVGVNIEMITMSFYCVYDLFRARAAVHACPIYADTVLLKSCENPFKCMLLTEAYIRITVTVLYANYMLTNYRYCGLYPVNFLYVVLASHFAVSINWWLKSKSYFLPLHNSPVYISERTKSSFIVSAVLKSYDFPGTEDVYVLFETVNSFMARRIPEPGVKGYVAHKMVGDIFNARIVIEEYAHERTDYFTVAEGLATFF